MNVEPQEHKSGDADPIRIELTDNIQHVHRLFCDTTDFIIRTFTIKQTGEAAALIYIDGLTDRPAINNDILYPLQIQSDAGKPGDELVMTVGHVDKQSDFHHIETAVLHGSSVLFIHGRTYAYVLGTGGWPQRAIEDPQMEASLKGAHQGFVETSGLNIAMIRRYIPNRELKMKRLVVGERGQTNVTILYLADVMNNELLLDMEKRIQQVDVDVILNTGELSELIEDNPFSLFPQFVLTERPDSAASQLLQGRCVVVVDRSPSVLVAPVSFFSYFQSIDDYSTRWSIATFLRLLRMFAFITAAFLPAFYIAVVSYHFEIIPMKLLLTLGESRGQVPFPPFVEAIIMEITLEMLREAGVRLPAPVGQTVGIVGGIVLGQAVVQAGLISNVMVIVVAFTAISSFILPNYDMVAAVRLIRFMLMILATLFGFVGIIVGLMTMIAHLLTLKSLGMPYGIPLAPVKFADWRDTIVRVPLWLMDKRPRSTSPKQETRQNTSMPKEEQP
ncbi:spore germination protein [Paenibacillus sinopodophylli]|uniref:spore germination protein n=1 Tax=Paenibacillus sinopodophylli TaxID=1837342 RepID=UPI00110CB5B7|nr:spore germination protein [Paenibacillus sinopodophylli]